MSGQARSNTGDAQKTNVWAIPGVLATLVAVASAFGAWSLLLPVLPTAVL
ncbi:MAG: MFS transporter, partial [Corynebacterium marinum]|nr:MFS transporter [Corynebacterium marinum]